MARYTGPVCKLCRRENMKLFLKGDRCYGDKCSYTRRPYPPGQHGQDRQKLSEYAVRLREKQKVRRVYGLVEKQFREYYFEATRRRGRTGEEMLGLLERRLDNVVFRMGFAITRSQARQLVRHKHFFVNGKVVNIPSFVCKPGDKIEVREGSRKISEISVAIGKIEARPNFAWLEVDKDKFTGTVKGMPARDELKEFETAEQLPTIKEQLVIEYYSR